MARLEIDAGCARCARAGGHAQHLAGPMDVVERPGLDAVRYVDDEGRAFAGFDAIVAVLAGRWPWFARVGTIRWVRATGTVAYRALAHVHRVGDRPDSSQHEGSERPPRG